ncbi:hypothetical protein CBS101457_002709 [Exobasidium rhododendri]|nr:hypothetical protein CBS101457_002709 [Exobasidium rhododendri]
MVTATETVLIVGAGIGGLVFAQMLRKQGVAFEIFERDSERDFRTQGLAISLHSGLSPLQKMTCSDLGNVHKASVNSKTGRLDTLSLYDALSGECLAQVGNAPEGEAGHVCRVRREEFRDMLEKNIPISYGKRFSHYVEDEEGVTAFFIDGSQARGSILIGADGASSSVRYQLLHQRQCPAPFIPILGECRLNADQIKPIYDLVRSACIVGKPRLRLFVGLQDVAADLSTADYYWTVSYESDDYEEEAKSVLLLSKEDLFKKATEQTKDILSAELLNLIRLTGPSGMRQPPIRYWDYIPPDSMPKSRVTLLGDAAHSMMPFLGSAANTAILDAQDLTNAITEARASAVDEQRNDKDLVHDLLQQYASKMIPRGKAIVLASRAAAENVESMYKSGAKKN